MTDYAKYQWSKMSPDRSEQVVIRSDDPVEWAENIALAKKQLPTPPVVQQAFPDDSGNMATPAPAIPVCPIHKKQMTQGKWGWYCKTPDPSKPKGWCTYRPK